MKNLDKDVDKYALSVYDLDVIEIHHYKDTKMKKTQVKGNVVKSPTWNKSMTVCTVRIAVDKAVQFKNDQGDFDYKTGYFDIKFFKKNLDLVKSMNLGSGDQIEVIGADVIVEYPSSKEPGLYKNSFEILADNARIISKKANVEKPSDEPESDFESWIMN